MYKLRDKIIFFKVIGFLLIIFLPSISMAASVTLDSGKKIEIDSNQLEKLIKMPGIFAIKHPPSSASSDLTFIKLPDELGGGFLVGTAENLIAGFEALEAEKKADKKTSGTFSGEAGIVLRNKDIDGDSSKAEEYRDLSTSVYGDVKIKYENKDKSFLKICILKPSFINKFIALFIPLSCSTEGIIIIQSKISLTSSIVF